MTKLLLRLAEKKHLNSRSGYARLSGIVCIVCNLLLCAVKFAVGALTGSVSVTADAVNNLSDSASNIVTLAGTKLSDKPVDKEHPFGHGRIEYVSALVIAVSIFVVSFELAKNAVEKMLHPAPLQYGTVYIVALSATVVVKLWMAFFNHRLYRLMENINMKAVKQDSLNDCVATVATIVSILLSHYFRLTRIDGVIGLGVSAFIFISGLNMMKQVISPLLGEPPSKEITDRITQIITESDIVYGVHDLVIHNYGANKKLASADAEVDAKADVFTIHRVIDDAERRIAQELNITICIHMDPVDKSDTQTQKYRLLAEGIIKEYNDAFSFHDFLLTEHDGKRVMHLELQLPFDTPEAPETIRDTIGAQLIRFCPEITPDISVEHSYIQEQ